MTFLRLQHYTKLCYYFHICLIVQSRDICLTRGLYCNENQVKEETDDSLASHADLVPVLKRKLLYITRPHSPEQAITMIVFNYAR